MDADFSKAGSDYRSFGNLVNGIKEDISKYALKDKTDYYMADHGRLEDLKKDLINAKTTFNSGEYKAIINMVELLNSKEQVPGTEKYKLDSKESHTLKLFTIKEQIDKYLDHKAKDGVNQNVYKKLAAVEALNKFVCSRINDLKTDTFSIGDRYFDYSSVKTKFDREDIGYDYRDAVKDYTAKDIGSSVSAEFSRSRYSTDPAECSNVMDCMGRIIQHAEDLELEGKIPELGRMRDQFFAHPNPEYASSKTVQKAAENKGPKLG